MYIIKEKDSFSNRIDILCMVIPKIWRLQTWGSSPLVIRNIVDIEYPSSIYGFCLPLWYLQSFLKWTIINMTTIKIWTQYRKKRRKKNIRMIRYVKMDWFISYYLRGSGNTIKCYLKFSDFPMNNHERSKSCHILHVASGFKSTLLCSYEHTIKKH
jgi:hypothetical protein